MPVPARPTPISQWLAAILRVRRAYRAQHGRAPRLLRPRRYTDKIQWRKLFDLNPQYAIFCDKLATRDFVAQRLGTAHLVPLLWQGSDPTDIPFDRLEPPFVLKSTHASGHVAMVGAGQPADRGALCRMAAEWLRSCHGTIVNEPGYIHVPRRLMIERQVTTGTGQRPPERRLFMFGGRVGVINTVLAEAGQIRNGAFHTPDWQRLPWYFTRDLSQVPFPRPQRLGEMIQAVEHLAAGLDHVRVDVFDGGDRFWIGEITVYPWSGFSAFKPDEADFLLGAMWPVGNAMARALTSLCTGRWEIKPPGASGGAPG